MMAARQSSTSLEEILSDESELNEINLYDSDGVKSSEPSANVGPRPYGFETLAISVSYDNIQLKPFGSQKIVPYEEALRARTRNCFALH